jgi:hypothetical protein
MRSFVSNSAKLFRSESLARKTMVLGGVRNLNVHEYVSFLFVLFMKDVSNYRLIAQ